MDYVKIKKFSSLKDTMKEVKRQSHKLREDVCKIYIQQRTSIYPHGGDRDEQQLRLPRDDAILP